MDDARVLDVPFTFTERASPVHPHLRPIWRMAAIALAVRRCGRHDRTTLRRLRVVDWLMVNPRLIPTLSNQGTTPTLRVVRFDPPLERAILFGAAEDLWAVADGTHVVLKDGGRQLADAIDGDDEIFVEEKRVATQIATLLTEDFVKSLLLSEHI